MMRTNERYKAASRFDEFAFDFLSALGLSVRLPDPELPPHDLFALGERGTYLIEVKLYGAPKVSENILSGAASQVAQSAKRIKSAVPVLFTNALVSPRFRDETQRRLKVVVIGLAEIKDTLGELPAYFQENLAAILSEASFFGHTKWNEIPASRSARDLLDLRNTVVAIQASASPVEAASPLAEVIATSLEAVQCGNSQSSQFEKACVAALKFLFGTHLSGWMEQISTNEKLHRFDLIARVASEDGFWGALISDFRSRYVVFEFKNHCGQITQGEIYSTEKYLYPAAMRGTAIVISNKGPDRNARKASRGALRESGKVILHLTKKEVCSMLRGLERGQDPSDRFAELLYEHLRHLDR